MRLLVFLCLVTAIPLHAQTVSERFGLETTLLAFRSAALEGRLGAFFVENTHPEVFAGAAAEAGLSLEGLRVYLLARDQRTAPDGVQFVPQYWLDNARSGRAGRWSWVLVPMVWRVDFRAAAPEGIAPCEYLLLFRQGSSDWFVAAVDGAAVRKPLLAAIPDFAALPFDEPPQCDLPD